MTTFKAFNFVMKKPLFQKIHLTENKSFNILKVDRPYFIVPWHFHPEIEIMLITNGTGTRFVGDSIEGFAPYDLVMVGSNLVHVWKNSHQHYEESSNLLAEARVILFREDCFGKDFFNIPEMSAIKNLLVRAGRGLKFFGKTRLSVTKKIIAAYEQSEFDRFLSLIELLHELSQSEEYSMLSSIGYVQQVQASDLYHLNIILDYLIKNFRQEIKLEQIASLANMSPTAFCRYFKSRTNKTLIQFINELRIGYAKKMLVESRDNISTICFEAGFHNISNFYDHFNKITGKLPSQFRKEHHNKIILE
jgi:AraC-like DNA-binding protein